MARPWISAFSWSPRRRSWRRESGLDDDPELARLLLGSGGDYDVSALRTRAQMLDDVASEVNLESQDLATMAAVLFGQSAPSP